MGISRREFLASAAAFAGMSALSACSGQGQQDPSPQDPAQPPADVDLTEFEGLALNMSAWKYDEDNDVYYQLKVPYCKEPATTTYESLAIFVPGAFLTGEKNGSTYACTVNQKAVVGAFTPATAPVLMPINTGSLAAQASPTSYSYQGLAPYLSAGCVYVYAGFRGRSAGVDTTSGSDEIFAGGAPWPVVDLKAAVRFLRYNDDALPCDTARTFVFGFGGGGGVSQVLGASGDSSLFDPYLAQIGAITHDAKGWPVSDAIAGSASWCPVTSLDVADAAYEWAAGQYATDETRAEGTWTRALSRDLAAAYADHVNELGLRGYDDAAFTLDEGEKGVYAEGSYTDELLSVLGESATTFLQSTPFPYAYTPQRIEDPTFPGDPNLQATRQADAAAAHAQADAEGDVATTEGDSAATEDAATAAATTEDAATAAAPAAATEDAATATAATPAPAAPEAKPTLTGLTQVESTIYDSPESYFGALNANASWAGYDEYAQTVTIDSLGDFSRALRPAERPVCPFDSLSRSSKTNQLFGIGEESTLHFSELVGGLVDKNQDAYSALSGWDKAYASAWKVDLRKTDALATPMATRVSMMSPLFYLSGAYDGYGQSAVAAHWRVNEGLFDTDVALGSALNCVLALRKYDGVRSVDYNPVWGQGHVLAERAGAATTNLVQWVIACCTA